MTTWRNHQKRAISDQDSLLMAADLAGERPPTGQLRSGSVPGAWRMARGRSQVLHPGRGRSPGRNRLPRQDFRQCSGPMRSGRRKRRPGARNTSESPVQGPVRPYLAVDGPSTRSGTPAHWSDVLGRCLWGLADGARPLPSSASRPQPSSRAEIGVRGITLAYGVAYCAVIAINFSLINNRL